MGKYFILQCKRLCRCLPGAILAALILLGGLGAVFSLTMARNSDLQENRQISVALVGYTEDPLLEMGLSMLQSMDSTRYSIKVLMMEESEAQMALITGGIAAYAIVPEDFVDLAMQGQVEPLELVYSAGSVGLSSFFKEDISMVISDLVLCSERGVFAMSEAAAASGEKPWDLMNDMSFRYVDYILVRDRAYQVAEIGIGNELNFSAYLLCGFSVLFVLLCCLSFAPIMITADLSLNRMLSAKGRKAAGQSAAEYFAYFLALLILIVFSLALLACFTEIPFFDAVLHVIPVVLMTAAFSYFLYTLATDLVGGVILQFFISLFLCFLSGCLYPVYFFPVSVQKLASYLPTGIARAQLAGIVTGSSTVSATIQLLLYSLLFVAAASLLRRYRVKGGNT